MHNTPSPLTLITIRQSVQKKFLLNKFSSSSLSRKKKPYAKIMQTKMESCSSHREEINSIKKAKLFIFLSTQKESEVSSRRRRKKRRRSVGTSYNFESERKNCFLICIIFAHGTFHYFSCFSCTRRKKNSRRLQITVANMIWERLRVKTRERKKMEK